jgi:hypothetical protein
MRNAVAIRSAITPLQHYEAVPALIAAAGRTRSASKAARLKLSSTVRSVSSASRATASGRSDPRQDAANASAGKSPERSDNPEAAKQSP